MRAPLSWLKHFVTHLPRVEDVVEAFDSIGLVVEEVNSLPEIDPQVVLARVLSVESIKGADLIRKVIVADPQERQVICGAPNVSVGQLVALAKPGAFLPGLGKLEARKFRGVLSEGMLLSAKEIGIGADASGLFEFGKELSDAVGSPVVELLKEELLPVLEIEVPPNRGDCMSIYGLARELAAKLRTDLAPIEIKDFATFEHAASVEIQDPSICDALSARVIEVEEMGQSPTRVALRISLSGMRPIHLAVDATNYVMLEVGQPTHAYDLAKLSAAHLGARAAKDGEAIECLDGKVRTLGQAVRGVSDATGDCVIIDSEDRAVGIGGVIGGASTAVSPDTKAVLLEAAHFSPVAISRTSRRLQLRTEASVRFERGVDPDLFALASDYVASIIASASEGARVGPIAVADSVRRDTTVLKVDLKRIEKFLGTPVEKEDLTEPLTRLGFAAMQVAPDSFELKVPRWRPDVVAEADVAEEVARFRGYETIAFRHRRAPFTGALSAKRKRRRGALSTLAACGFNEVFTAVFCGEKDAICAEGLAPLTVANPLNAQERRLRTSLIPGLLKAARSNATRLGLPVRIFEAGKVFSYMKDSALEREHLAAVVVEQELKTALKAIGEAAQELSQLTGHSIDFEKGEPEPEQLLHSTALFLTPIEWLSLGGVCIGAIGLPRYPSGNGAVEAVLVCDLEAFCGIEPELPEVKAPSRFPEAEIDLAFVAPEGIQAERIRQVLQEAGGDLIERIWLFDVYRGEPLKPGEKNLAFRLQLSSREKTLSDDDLAEIRSSLIQAVESRGLGRLR